MTTAIGLNPSNPYETPDAINETLGLVNAAGGTIFQTTITTSPAVSPNPIVSGSTEIFAETYNGAIPGPTFKLTVGDTVIVRLINNLPYPTGIHWHGIELTNSADGTPVTQDGAVAHPPGNPPQTINGVDAGGTYLYKFQVTRPGLYWYHPHHHHSTNRVFRGLYGMIVVTDPDEATLEGTPLVANTLPTPDDTYQLVLSDITVCKAPGLGLNLNYAPPSPPADAEWLGSPGQPGPTPETLCELFPMNEDGTARLDGGGIDPDPFTAGFVPNIQKGAVPIDGFQLRTNEGQTVLTNGVNVGWREGTPTTDDGAPGPGTLDPDAYTLSVTRGQRLRIQIVNCATTRFFRLRLTTEAGVKVSLFRIGGEGGLLDNAVLEGGDDDPVTGDETLSIGAFTINYYSGEILIPPASRADIVATIPDDASGVLTLWTRDLSRTGLGFSRIPTVPVMHLEVNADPVIVVDPMFAIGAGTPLRAKPGFPGGVNGLVEDLPAATGTLLHPPPKTGFSGADVADTSDIKLTNIGQQLGIDGIEGVFPGTPYTHKAHIGSTRYAARGADPDGSILELTVTNNTGAHHPFHLHGFSFQPKSLELGGVSVFDWPYQEFRDNIDVPNDHTLRFRVRITNDRTLADEITLGGELGRWLFHCHIFFHAHGGMISEFVVTDADGLGGEKPYVDVGGSWEYAPDPGFGTRSGTFYHRDGETVSLTSTLADGSPIGVMSFPGGASEGNWSWTLDTVAGPLPPAPEGDGIYYVYITATTAVSNRKDQAVFRLKVGNGDDGSDNGDPHIHTVDGKTYHFQAVGEFTMLRDREGMEIQTRQTPGQTANTFNDSYSGLTSSVSVNTAVAARVGAHQISYQPGEERGRLQFFLDGKPSQLSTEGIDLEGHRVSAFDADGETGLRVDYEHHGVLTVTPRFSTWVNMWYMNVSVSHTQGNEGLMGSIPDGSWLPTLRSGATVGPMPAALHDRYIALYKTFANSWRVTDESSLFVYAPGTSTATFTDEDWPAETHPSTLKPQFEIPGAQILPNIDIEDAERICRAVTDGDLHRDCVFDVVTTGDETFAKGYLFAQDLKLHGSTVQIVGDKEETRPGESLVVTATVSPISSGRPTPTGCVTFLVNGVAAGPPVKLDKRGQASLTMDRLDAGEHKIRAVYEQKKLGCLFAIFAIFAIFGGRKYSYHSSTSPNLLHTVGIPVPTP